MKTSRFLTCMTLLFVTLALPLKAQRINVDKIKSQYPEKDAIILNQREHLHIEQAPGTSELKIWLESEKETLILHANKGLFSSILSNDFISYNSFSAIENIQAETKVPISRNNYRSVPVSSIEEQDVQDGNIFFSGEKRKKIIYPAVEDGAILRLKYEEHLSEPRFLTPFSFSSYVPMRNAEYKVTFPNSVELAYVLYGENTDLVAFEKQEANGFTTYTWRGRNLDEYRNEPNAPSIWYYCPQVIVYIKRYQANGQTINLLQDESGLYNWYQSLVQQVNNELDAEIESIVADLVKGKESDYEKAKAIFNWVQSNIQYVAFEEGLGGFIPRDPVNVCNKRYGDCKDMANLLCQMLNYVGLEAYLTWIGTRSIPYSYYEVPTAIVDNHMITTLILDGERLFLDATGKYTPFPLPTPMIQGKEAMIGMGDGQFEIHKVPEVEKEKNLLIDSTFLKIQDRDLLGKAKRHAPGFFQLDLDSRRNLIEEKDIQRFWNAYLSKGNNKFALTSFQPKSVLSEWPEGISIPYDFELPGYVKKIGDRLLVNMHLNRRFQTSNIDLETRKLDKEFEFKYIHRDINILELPEGYTASYLPESLDLKNEKFGFHIQYNQENGQIILEKEVYIDTLLLNPEDFKSWNEMIDQLVNAYREVIVLTKQ